MLYRDNKEQESPKKRFLFILGVVMFTIYFVLGLVVIFYKDWHLALSSNLRTIFGSVLVLYSFLRLIRLLQTRKGI